MTKHFLPIFLVAISVFMLSSCLGSDDDEVTYYEDTAITAFTLGTLNVNHQTKASDGVTDSTYVTTLTGSTYKFNIDQLRNTIYNTDSLPYGTDVAHVLATISSKNSGMVVLNLKDKSGADSLAYYSSTDSIDFTDPVRIRVYNMMSSAYREYSVTVNAHKEKADSFKWNVTTGDLASVGKRKLLSLGSDIFLFGVENGVTVGYKKAGGTWERLATSGLDADACDNITAFNNKLYTINANSIVFSSDGQQWSEVAPSQGIRQLLGATAFRVYALTETGIAYSTDLTNWKEDRLDDNFALLPNEDLNLVWQASVMNSKVNHLVLVGNRDGKTMVWSKVEENDNANSTEPWAYYPEDAYNRKTLPYLANLRVVVYDGKLLATGGDLSKFYVSPDKGLTWERDTTYVLPDSYVGNSAQFGFCKDNSNVLYFSKSGDNSVLMGRLARLGWKEDDGLFTE